MMDKDLVWWWLPSATFLLGLIVGSAWTLWSGRRR